MKQFLKNRPVKILLIILAVVAGFACVGWLYYESQRPNYNDLQKAYNQLEIPSDWKLVSQSDNKGTWGKFCWQIGGESCPYLQAEFKRNPVTSQSEVSKIIMDIGDTLSAQSYTVNTNSYQKCSEKEFNEQTYTCSISGVKNGIEVYYSIDAVNSKGTKGDFAHISVSPYGD